MSYDVELIGPDGAIATVDRHEEGGTYECGGTTEASLNVTYNYGEVYRIFEFSLKDLDGKRAGEMARHMEMIVKKCGTNRFKDYWAPTPGNAGHALSVLLGWAREHPDAVFRVS